MNNIHSVIPLLQTMMNDLITHFLDLQLLAENDNYWNLILVILHFRHKQPFTKLGLPL